MSLDFKRNFSRRTFLKMGVRNLLLGLFLATGTVLGLRRLRSDPANRVNLLPCDNCSKYPACDYGQTNFEKRSARVAKIADCP